MTGYPTVWWVCQFLNWPQRFFSVVHLYWWSSHLVHLYLGETVTNCHDLFSFPVTNCKVRHGSRPCWSSDFYGRTFVLFSRCIRSFPPWQLYYSTLVYYLVYYFTYWNITLYYIIDSTNVSPYICTLVHLYLRKIKNFLRDKFLFFMRLLYNTKIIL